MNRINLICTQAFARSSTRASSGVRENVLPNNKLELCWKILFLMKLFINLFKLLFNLIHVNGIIINCCKGSVLELNLLMLPMENKPTLLLLAQLKAFSFAISISMV